MNYVGIDVGCNELVMAVSMDGQFRKAKTFENNWSGYTISYLDD